MPKAKAPPKRGFLYTCRLADLLSAAPTSIHILGRIAAMKRIAKLIIRHPTSSMIGEALFCAFHQLNLPLPRRLIMLVHSNLHAAVTNPPSVTSIRPPLVSTMVGVGSGDIIATIYEQLTKHIVLNHGFFREVRHECIHDKSFWFLIY